MNELSLRQEYGNQVVEPFIDQLDVSVSSKKTYRRDIKNFMDFVRRRATDADLTENDILQYKIYLQAQSPALSPLTINNRLVAVKLLFKYLHKKGVCIDLGCEIKLLKRSADFYRDALSLEETKELLTSIDLSTPTGIRNFAIINLLLRTGMRTIEVSRANNEDIIKMDGESVLLVQGKGSHEKNAKVVLTRSLVKIIMAWQQTKAIIEKEEPLFYSLSKRNHGNRLAPGGVGRIVSDQLKEALLKTGRVTAHSLRHTAITLSLKGGATVQEAQQMARHANINTTMIYAHNIDRIKNAAELRIEEMLETNMDGHNE